MLDDREILSLIEEYERNSYGQNDQELSDSREEALDRFYGRPYGDEIDGRSQVVSQDTKDTILWVMPQLMKVFAAGDEVVKFSPKSAEDVLPAEQETAYVNHLVMEKNRGFEILYNWFFDALLSKVGYVKAYWEDYEDTKREAYREISGEEAAYLLQNPDVQILAHEEFTDELGRDYHTLVLEVKQKNGCVRICNIPPENMMVSYSVSGTSLADADFAEEISETTLGDLRSQGYDVDESVVGESEYGWGSEEDARDRYSEGDSGDWQTGAARKVTLREAYVKLDDGGKLTRYRVLIAGKTILEKDEAEEVPFASLCPIPMPHRHVGLSYADIVADLERIKTQLLRNSLDAQYLSIHGRWAIGNRVNLDDMLVSRAGGVVRVDMENPTGAVVPMFNPQDGSSGFQAMEYVDSILQKRTGVSEKIQGIAEDALDETATATAKLMSAAQERIYMLARIFAETGIKDLFMLVHGLTRRHASKDDIFQLRNKWVPVDPRTWATRKDMTVAVGLGTGDKEEMRIHLMTILQAQKEALAIGIATPKNIYNALAKLTQNAGFKDIEEFWTDPATNKMPQRPDPEMAKLQSNAQIEQMKMQSQAQLEQMKIQLEAQKQTMQAENDMREREHQAQLQAQQAAQQLDFDRWKAQLESETRIIVAEISANASRQNALAAAEAKAQAAQNVAQGAE